MTTRGNALDRHAAEHLDAGEADRDDREWITTRKLVDAYESQRRQRATEAML
jgi:hypothetical protein